MLNMASDEAVTEFNVGDEFKMAELIYEIVSMVGIVKCTQRSANHDFPPVVYLTKNQLRFVQRIDTNELMIAQIDNALSRYYAHFDRQYDALFKTFCEENGFELHKFVSSETSSV